MEWEHNTKIHYGQKWAAKLFMAQDWTEWIHVHHRGEFFYCSSDVVQTWLVTAIIRRTFDTDDAFLIWTLNGTNTSKRREQRLNISLLSQRWIFYEKPINYWKTSQALCVLLSAFTLSAVWTPSFGKEGVFHRRQRPHRFGTGLQNVQKSIFTLKNRLFPSRATCRCAAIRYQPAPLYVHALCFTLGL